MHSAFTSRNWRQRDSKLAARPGANLRLEDWHRYPHEWAHYGTINSAGSTVRQSSEDVWKGEHHPETIRAVGERRSLYVGNLDPTTGSQQVRALFENGGYIV